MTHPELAELETYLGVAFDPLLLRGHERAVQEELARVGDEATLYRTSETYLYDLAVFAASGTKAPYLDVLRSHLPAGARVLDYGCGIGSDGLALLEAGYDVAFADFDNPSVAYLRWRLARRGLEAPVFDLDAPGGIPAGFDLAYAFDVLEHVEDPFATLARMEALASRVLVNVLAPVPDDTVLHHPLPVRSLVRHAARRRLRAYHRLHGRSHLLLYETGPAERRTWRARAVLARVRSARRWT